jgi:hypothetical protein
MAKSDLLKEAIADARTVKETALANAKIALQEAFAPRIESMLSAKLAEELEDEQPIDAPIEGEENLEAPVEDDMGAGEDGDVNWIDNDLSFQVGGQQFDAQVNNPISDTEVGAGMAGEFGDEEMTAENPEDEYAEDDDLDLEEIILELEGADSMHNEPEDDDIDPEHRVQDGSDIDAEMYRRDEGSYSQEDDIDEIIEAILREEEDGEEDDKHMMEAELEDTKKELEEAYRTVKQMQSVIQEVNLLNAKLLYTNKLFRNFDLNEGQKMKVLENFDRAANTREVKLVFSTLAESFVKPTKKRVVKESYASKPVATTNPKTNTPILTEGFAQAERWKKLAGLL